MRSTIIVTALALTVACSRNDKTTTEEPTGEATLTAATIEARPNDDELIRRIEAAIGADPQLSILARNVEVDVDDGYVALRGSVDSDATKKAIEMRAGEVAGVRTTLNKLDVREAAPDEVDDTIAFSIQRALATDPALAPDAKGITIDVRGGVVTLRGSVSSPFARLTIERVIEKRPGVVTVQNRLAIPNG